MKHSTFYLLFIGFFVIGVWGCKKTGTGTAVNLSVFNPTQTPTDKYIYDSFTLPYNVEVKYRFDGNDNGGNNVGATLVPPYEDKIIPLLRAIRKVWIDTYELLAGGDFIRTYIPKQIVLVGSKRYNSNGTVTLGVAEGGKRILLFDVNSFDLKNNFRGFAEIIHTIEHEFAHILHQTVDYPLVFKSISLPADYTAQWYNVSSPENYQKGFVTSYAMSNPDEDFVETLSNVLYLGEDSILKLFPSDADAGKVLATQKIGTVRTYLQDIWNINFKVLEDSTLSAMNTIKEAAKKK